MRPNEQVADLVKAAIECDPSARRSFLDAHCRPGLRAEVESLLAHQQLLDGFMETPALHLAAETFASESACAPAEILGHYEIIARIGKGGMGEVYLAEDRQLHRRVALKLVRRGMDTESVVRRFKHEQRLLAALNHPNIAQLYQADVTADGIPYFAMEHVAGTRIDDYCRQKSLTVRDRLALFVKVCAAVHYAHQHLVVHRDIKPSNILVTDGGEPKLLDFGIAKLLESESDGLEETITIAGVMTPEYASPEHVRGEPISTASDIYSLGVLLYELLTDSKPYRIEMRKPMELARIISEAEPKPPSAVVKSLDRDLDNIVLMAMRKQAQRRYSSAAQLAADIERHLDGLPVIARKDTFAYRSSKFVARHRVGVTAAALVIVTLVAGIIATIWQARVARQQRDRAHLEATRAERIKTFLQDTLATASPLGHGPDTKVVEALDQATKQVETDLAGEPEVLIEIETTIGYTYFRLSRRDDAEKVLRSAVVRAKNVLGERHPLTALSEGTLAVVISNSGDMDGGEAFARQALATQRALYPGGHRDMYRTLTALAYSLGEKGQTAAALVAADELLSICRRFIGERSFEMMEAIALVGAVKYDGGDGEGAEPLYRQAIDLGRSLGRGDAIMPVVFSNLGLCLTMKGKYEEARDVLEHALPRIRQQWGGQSYSVGLILSNLGWVYFVQGDYRKTVETDREAAEILRKVVNPEHETFAGTLITLSMALSRVGEAREGEGCAREVLAKSHSAARIAQAKGALGEALAAQEKSAEAEPLLIESYNDLRTTHGPTHYRTKIARDRLIQFYQRLGQPEKAEQYRAEALAP